jgi:EF hand
MFAITRRVRIGLAATILAALPALAFAQPGPDDDAAPDAAAAPGAGFTGDRVEKRAHRRARLLKKFDINGNGKLDRPERQVALRMKIEKVVARLDADGSGSLSLGEASVRPRSALARKFHQIDANGNGLLSTTEIRSAKAVKLMPGKGKGKGKGKGRRSKRHGGRLAPV